ncbi:hypothetical protein [Actinomarinicola tropica]|uniref:Uncharacterized protein n=1 Tax=Actinomarinicola tropica TaxID=2789776 RepID=A0A5Q2RHZ8_9ACTN|nr:hypothetical protein [Actinomarinicola tropica]QGG95433.1 hypothetical protein GH723_10170 [Actinomarinicola tropica]
MQPVRYVVCTSCQGRGRTPEAHAGAATEAIDQRRAEVPTALLAADQRVGSAERVLNAARRSMGEAIVAIRDATTGDDPLAVAAERILDCWEDHQRALDAYLHAVRSEVQIYAERFIADR